MVTRCRVRPLSAADFQEFGEVFAIGNCTNVPQGAADLVQVREGGKPNLLLLRVSPKPLPLVVNRLERHPYSSQSFIPLDGGRYLVIVAPSGAGGAPETNGLRAFIADHTQIVTLKPGTWHFEATTLADAMRFAVIMWCEHPNLDTEFAGISDIVID
jgi:ureidoglycolate lyase